MYPSFAKLDHISVVTATSLCFSWKINCFFSFHTPDLDGLSMLHEQGGVTWIQCRTEFLKTVT